MNALNQEFKDKLPSILANMVLVFGALGFFSSVLLNTVIEGRGYLSWLVFVIVAGIFLIRALSIVLVIADNAIGILITHLGIQKPWSRNREAKDLIFIIVVILAFAG